MRGPRLLLFGAWVLLIGVSAPECGGSGSSSTVTPQPVVLTYTNPVPSGSHRYQDFQATRSGTMTVTVRWNDGAEDLDLYVTTQGCNYWEERCANSLLARSEAASGTQEQVRINAQSGTSYTFWVLNYGDSSEEARVEVRIE